MKFWRKFSKSYPQKLVYTSILILNNIYWNYSPEIQHKFHNCVLTILAHSKIIPEKKFISYLTLNDPRTKLSESIISLYTEGFLNIPSDKPEKDKILSYFDIIKAFKLNRPNVDFRILNKPWNQCKRFNNKDPTRIKNFNELFFLKTIFSPKTSKHFPKKAIDICCYINRNNLMRIHSQHMNPSKLKCSFKYDTLHGKISDSDNIQKSDITSQLLQKRIIFLTGEVTDEVSNLAVSQILHLYSQNPSKDITILINSPGGSVTAGFSIFDVMQYVDCDIQTVSFGLAASMGAFLLSSGTKGKRKSFPNSRIMIHQPLGGARGKVSDIEIQAKEILYTRLILNTYLSHFTNQTIERIEEDCDRDFFMSPVEAKEYGLIDEILYTKTSNITLPSMAEFSSTLI